jgi:hypothetical protein
MLPALRPLAQPVLAFPAVRAALRSLLGRLVSLALCGLLLLPMTACGGAGQPPRAVLLDALALQIQLTQGAIAQALELEPQPDSSPEVSRVRVASQESLAIGGGRGLHLTGQFDWRLPGDAIRVDSPFDLYLQRGERGQSWRLAQPSGSSDGTTQEWLTYPLPLKA